MGDFDRQSMEKVIAVVGEPDPTARRDLCQMLGQAGITQISAHGDLADIVNLIVDTQPDLIVLSNDLNPAVFDFIRDIRHNKVGKNPFVLITTLVAPGDDHAVKQAVQAGTDDIVIKPVKEEQLLQRLKRVMINRPAFVVTSDYVGPDRRAKVRPSTIGQINVLNTMLEKASGREVDAGHIQQAVDSAINDVLRLRMDSHGLRLGVVCTLLAEAYRSAAISPVVQEKLGGLADVLCDAAKTAVRLKDIQLAVLCGSLSRDVERITERYVTPVPRDIDVIEKISRAVVSAVKPRTAPDKLREEIGQSLAVYRQRPRLNFSKTYEIQRTRGEAPVEIMSEPVIEILPLAKGQLLFKRGEAATSAYILNSGTILIFKEIDGVRQPIARVKPGEFFGELAIIDGRPRRNSAMALEECTVSLVAKDMIEEKLATSDPMIRTLLHMMSNSLRMVHESYAPKGRNVVDAVREMKEQIRYIQRQIESGSPERRKASALAVTRAAEIADDIAALIESVPDLDRRTPAVPSLKELPS